MLPHGRRLPSRVNQFNVWSPWSSPKIAGHRGGAAVEAKHSAGMSDDICRWLRCTPSPNPRSRASRANLQRPLLNAWFPSVGDQINVKTLTPAGAFAAGGGAHWCDDYLPTTGTVRAVSTHAIVASDNASPTGGFSTVDYQQIAAEFDSLIYPTDVSLASGTPTDLDNNGHIIIYYTPSVNNLTPAGTAQASGYVGGFFFAGDPFDTTGTNPCAESNKRPRFFIF